MRSIVAMLVLAAGAAACGPPPNPKALPSDLPPPEYEKPRGYDLPGAKAAPGPQKAPDSAPPAAPAPAPPAPAPKP
ncbi:MAG: hypothetical protein QM820_42160 [Minicystis sp.]